MADKLFVFYLCRPTVAAFASVTYAHRRATVVGRRSVAVSGGTAVSSRRQSPSDDTLVVNMLSI